MLNEAVSFLYSAVISESSGLGIDNLEIYLRLYVVSEYKNLPLQLSLRNTIPILVTEEMRNGLIFLRVKQCKTNNSRRIDNNIFLVCYTPHPILLGDINNSSLWMFSHVVSSPTLIKKKKKKRTSKILFNLNFYFSQSNLREATWHDIFSLSVGACHDQRHVWGPTAITTISKHVWRQILFLSKSYLFSCRRSETKFPADWKNIHLLSDRESKIYWY